MHASFAIEFDLSSPVIIDRGIALAGLLARLLADQGDLDPLANLPLANVDGVHAGSDLFVLGSSLEYHIAYVRSLRPTAMPHDLALRDGRRGMPREQITLRGDLKNLLDTREATSAPTLVAFGAGNLDRVALLLKEVMQLGAKRGGGYGTVDAVRINPIDHPHAGFADRDGNPLRAVPAEVWRQMNLPPQPVRSLVARLPRWASPRESCVGPRTWTMEPGTFARELSP